MTAAIYAKTLLSAIALVGAGLLLLADSTDECGELEPLPADFNYDLHCTGAKGVDIVTAQGMFVRYDDDQKLRNEGLSVQPETVGVSISPSVLWDRAQCSGGEGVGVVDGLMVEVKLSTDKAGVATVVCSGPRASVASSSSSLICKVEKVALATAASGSAYPANGAPPEAQDAGSSDAGADSGATSSPAVSSWDNLSCSMTIKHLPAK